MAIFDWWLKRVRWWIELRSGDGPAQVLRDVRSVVDPCPVCGKKFEGHAYWDLAMVEARTKLESMLRDLIAQEKWDEAQKIRVVNQQRDLRKWRLYRCPTGQTMVVEVFSPFALWLDDVAELKSEVRSKQSVDDVVAGRWISLSTR
ncbi:MAG TPA: hypothetical protein VNG73_08365 [Gemmatimonadaceae bacterium]|nr:hypothetical protein [Gemmatimonadaceae bacterium]